MSCRCTTCRSCISASILPATSTRRPGGRDPRRHRPHGPRSARPHGDRVHLARRSGIHAAEGGGRAASSQALARTTARDALLVLMIDGDIGRSIGHLLQHELALPRRARLDRRRAAAGARLRRHRRADLAARRGAGGDQVAAVFGGVRRKTRLARRLLHPSPLAGEGGAEGAGWGERHCLEATPPGCARRGAQPPSPFRGGMGSRRRTRGGLARR